MVLSVVCQALGTLCLVAVVATVTSCSDDALGHGDICQRFCETGQRTTINRRGDCPEGLECRSNMAEGVAYFDNCHNPDTCQNPPPKLAAALSAPINPCAGYDLGQPCITSGNLHQCHDLLAGGCTEQQLTVMESCPLQFGCSSGIDTSTPSTEPEGPSGTSSAGPVPYPLPAQQSHSLSASASGGLCDNKEAWVALTQFFGVLGGILLVSATPLLSCRSDGCAGPKASRQLLLSWGLCAACGLLFVVCGALGLGYGVKIPMVVPVIGICCFQLAFALMFHASFSFNSLASFDPESSMMADCNPLIPPVPAARVHAIAVVEATAPAKHSSGIAEV